MFDKLHFQVGAFANSVGDFKGGALPLNVTIDQYELVTRFQIEHERELCKADRDSLQNTINILQEAMDAIFAR